MVKKRRNTKAKAKRTSKRQKATYRVRTWATYNESLVQRGSITFWISEEVIAGWQPEPEEPPEALTVAGAFIKAMKQGSAIGAPEARVDGRSKLAKDGPEETDAATPGKGIINTGNPLTDDVFGSILSGRFQKEMRDQLGGA